MEHGQPFDVPGAAKVCPSAINAEDTAGQYIDAQGKWHGFVLNVGELARTVESAYASGWNDNAQRVVMSSASFALLSIRGERASSVAQSKAKR